MMGKPPVFKEIIDEYLRQVAYLEPREEIGRSLGIAVIEGGYRIPFFHRTYTIAAEVVTDENGKSATHAVSVILCKYILMCPNRPSEDVSLITYKDFKDAAPYAGGFSDTAKRPICEKYSNNINMLKQRSLDLGGKIFPTEVACQLAMRFEALPKVSIVLMFHDADEDFPAQATLLFQNNAASYLDMECLAMIGGALAHYL